MTGEMIDRVAKAMLPIFNDNGMPISCPDDVDLDDVERERWNALVAAARAAIEAIPTADAIEAWLRTAPFEKVKAVHDLCHATMSDRFSWGIRPSPRALKTARAAIEAEKISPPHRPKGAA